MGQALVNGKAYSASDISVIIAGISVASISNLVVTETLEKVNNKGFSNEPVSRGRGTKEYECSVDLSYKDVVKLQNLSPTKSLIDIPMFQVLAVLNNGTNVSKIRVKNAEFTDDGIEASAEDSEIKRTYNLIIAGIDRF